MRACWREPEARRARLWRALRGEGERRHARARRLEGVLSVAAVDRRAAEGLRTRRCATRWLQLAGIWPAGFSGGVETGHLLLGVGLLAVGVGEDECHRLGGEVAALHQPLVILLE